MTVGWQGGLTLTPNTREDTLLYPRVFSFQSTKFLGREGMDIRTYEVKISNIVHITLHQGCFGIITNTG